MTLYEPAFNVADQALPAALSRRHHRHDAGRRLRQHAVAFRLVALAAVAAALALARWPCGWRCCWWRWRRCTPGRCAAPRSRRRCMGRLARRRRAGRCDAGRSDAAAARSGCLTVTFTSTRSPPAALWAHMMPAFAAKGLSGGAGADGAGLVRPGAGGRAACCTWASAAGLSPRALGLVVLAGAAGLVLLFALGRTVPRCWSFALLFGVANGLVTHRARQPGARVLRPRRTSAASAAR